MFDYILYVPLLVFYVTIYSALGADDESLLYKAATVNTTTTTSSSNGNGGTHTSSRSSLVSVGHRCVYALLFLLVSNITCATC